MPRNSRRRSVGTRADVCPDGHEAPRSLPTSDRHSWGRTAARWASRGVLTPSSPGKRLGRVGQEDLHRGEETQVLVGADLVVDPGVLLGLVVERSCRPPRDDQVLVLERCRDKFIISTLLDQMALAAQDSVSSSHLSLRSCSQRSAGVQRPKIVKSRVQVVPLNCLSQVQGDRT